MKNKNKNNVYYFSLCLILLITVRNYSQSNTTLWYTRPAEFFEETLVLGNGKVGASVFGGVNSDKIYLNDATLWSGEPVDTSLKISAFQHIPEIRAALANEDYELAEKLNKNIQGKFSESFSPLGTLSIEFEDPRDYKNYYRELNLKEAVAKVEYDIKGNHFSREYFISHPDKIMVIKLSSREKGALRFKIHFSSLLKYYTHSEGKTFKIEGYAPYHAEPDYRGNIPNAVLFDENRGTRFSTYLKVKNVGGQISFSDSTISVNNANEATVFISIATSFNGFDKDPAKNGLDNKVIAQRQLLDVSRKSYVSLKENHRKDYQSFFNRVRLDLNDNTTSGLPTDERLKKYSEGAEDKNLEVLYFQYGRYLLISSSRTKNVPANLQGLWNPYIRPPWSSNYTMNINAEENYWLAENANLSEMHIPFLTFIGNLAETGKATAKEFYGVNKGWAACHNSDIWAMSNPVGDYGKGDPMWACWNMSGAWSVTHLWDHYLFTGDKNFLKNYAYPLMKGAAEFCRGWLVKDKKGFYVTSPSTSPENVFRTPAGYKGATLYGSTSDLAMIRECFNQTIKASQELRIDKNFRDSLLTLVDQLYPYQIGKRGNLQEWYYDWEDPEPQHRHQSHLYGLFPGNQITPEKTSELANACKKTLEIKGDETTGWSKGWRINLWARLNDGNRAYKLFRELLTYVEPDGAKKTNYSRGGGTYPNLFDAHPPFQIDGNFGGAAGVIEMLLQSDDNSIKILPALPDVWHSGTVSGICARGGFELFINWKNGIMNEIKVLSKLGNKCTLNYRGKQVSFNTKKGTSYKLNPSLVINK